MRERNKELEEMDYVELDVTESMSIIEDGAFHSIIDKGTLDCVVCAE